MTTLSIQLWLQRMPSLGGTDELCLRSFGPEYRHDTIEPFGGPGFE